MLERRSDATTEEFDALVEALGEGAVDELDLAMFSRSDDDSVINEVLQNRQCCIVGTTHKIIKSWNKRITDALCASNEEHVELAHAIGFNTCCPFRGVAPDDGASGESC